MATWTVVGLINQDGDELYVAGVFAGQQRNCDTNVDAEIGGRLYDQFVGFFDTETADEAAEVARDVFKNPLAAPSATIRTSSRPVGDVKVKSNLL